MRPGAEEAYVEGVFALPDALREALGERLPADAEDLVLARRVSAEGRTRAYLGGRSATAADLRDAGGALLSFYGQHEHRRLMLASAQLEILDGFCGPPQAKRRAAFAALYARERELVARLEELRSRAGARDRELDVLEWELREIEAADPSEGEAEELRAERERLRHLEALRGAAGGAGEALTGDEGGAAGALGAALAALESVHGVDGELDELTARARALAVEADDLAGELRRYGEAIEAAGGQAGRLDQVEERLSVLERLERKHGGTIAAVLAHAEACRARREELTGAEEALDAASAQLASVRGELAAAATALRAVREAAAADLGAAVRQRLAGLAMEGAEFAAELSERDGYGPSGRRRGRVPDRAQPGRPAGSAAGDRVRRRAFARDAGADERRRRGGAGDARVRRGRRGDRRPDGAGGGGRAARPGGRPPDRLHHPPAADRLAGRPPLHDRQGQLGRDGPHDGHPARARRRRGGDRPDARRRRPGPRGAPARAGAAAAA